VVAIAQYVRILQTCTWCWKVPLMNDIAEVHASLHRRLTKRTISRCKHAPAVQAELAPSPDCGHRPLCTEAARTACTTRQLMAAGTILLQQNGLQRPTWARCWGHLCRWRSELTPSTMCFARAHRGASGCCNGASGARRQALRHDSKWPPPLLTPSTVFGSSENSCIAAPQKRT
jgi:hypothetical protein